MALKIKVSIDFDTETEKKSFFDYVLGRTALYSITDDTIADSLCRFYDEYTALADHFDWESIHKLCGELIEYVTAIMKENCGLEG